MSAELVHASVQKGLRGGSGFGTAVVTRGLAAPLERALEELSAYDFDPARAVGADRVEWAHRVLTVQGRSHSVLSRTAPCGSDWSGRPNRVAHHVVVDTAERAEAGPAWMLAALAQGVLMQHVPEVGERAQGPRLPGGALSARPLQLLRESELIATLAVSAAMRMQNLLLQRRCRRAQKFALTDPLTRLFNRRMGITSLDQAIARSHRSGVDLTVLMIDLDQFKKLNDTYGHVQGDQALRATADVLRKTLRRSDTICRYGGEEFMVVLPETSAEESAVLAARLFTAVEARGHEEKLPITVSIGQASVRQEDSAESLLNRADRALYASKAGGRNRFSIADEE